MLKKLTKNCRGENQDVDQDAKRQKDSATIKRQITDDSSETHLPTTNKKSKIATNVNRLDTESSPSEFITKDLPLVCASAMTIHKSQGSTYAEVVYEYDKKHLQSLLYVALSRVTDLQGLFIIKKNDDFTFYHGRRSSDSMRRLRDEFARLSVNSLVTIDQRLMNEFIDNQRSSLSIYSFNCQSLRAHTSDIVDKVLQNSKIVIFSETWIHDNENVDITNFKCVVKYKRPQVRAGGVAIYHNNKDNANIVTPSIDMSVRQSQIYTSGVTPVGEYCIAECIRQNGQTIVIAALYISPNQKLDDIIYFLKRSLYPYSVEGGTYLGRGEDKLPMILSGDFNVNFASDNSEPLKKFLKDIFNLTINNDKTIPTTRSGTTIDAVFSRYINNLESKTYISYFSYHKPKISVIPLESEDPLIEEIEM